MPIKPVYAERLIRGEKHFEFRKRPISFDLTHMVVYASSPIKKILGVVKVNRVRIGSPDDTWYELKKYAGIGEHDFTNYFSNSDIAYSIEIEPSKTIRLSKQVSPKEIDPAFKVPQSFKYVDNQFVELVLALGH
ncbi:MAG: hypothetical protein VKJ04_01795 [Vampirovibrionales bacterium]|nr:hypothetical protein [Vampirovibrionales bacterium]